MTNMIELVWVNPEFLHADWPVICEGLKQVKKSGDHWLLEDVYHAIKSQSAYLHMVTLDDVYKGFVITQQQAGYDGPILHIWAAYSNERKEAELLTQTFPKLIEWANNINAKRITFHSPRRGWEKNTLGFKPKQVIYEYEI